MVIIFIICSNYWGNKIAIQEKKFDLIVKYSEIFI